LLSYKELDDIQKVRDGEHGHAQQHQLRETINPDMAARRRDVSPLASPTKTTKKEQTWGHAADMPVPCLAQQEQFVPEIVGMEPDCRSGRRLRGDLLPSDRQDGLCALACHA
jgi:hypothetical protein